MTDDVTGWPIFGHTASVQFLQQLVKQSEQPEAKAGPRHAYLLLGARQVGKCTLAQTFAKALLCMDGATRPCNHCRNCQLFAHGNHPDFRMIQPVDKAGAIDRIGGTLRVEQALEVIRDVALRPMTGRYKIFLIQDLHTANDSFANKLLKTLEEPPAHAIFLLTAQERNLLLPTIVSRCQVLELRPLAPVTIAHALQVQWQVAAARADLLARLARGRLGWAVQRATEAPEEDTRVMQLEMLWQMLDAPPVTRLATAEKLATTGGGQQLFELLETWSVWWRDVLLTQAGCGDACCNIDQQSELERQANLLSPQAVQQYLRTLHRIEGYLHHTVNVRLALEVLLLQVPAPQPL
jgi:DNA polymerase-3 subunit delta'